MGRIIAGLFVLLLSTSAQAEPRSGADRYNIDRAERRALKIAARHEKKHEKLRKHAAYDLGRREALAEAAQQCATPGAERGQLALSTPGGRVMTDWRTSPLYRTSRARRIYVNGYYSCLRAHGLNPHFRDDLPVAAPAQPPIEEALPPPGADEKAYLDARSAGLWDDGIRACEQDLSGK